MNKKKEKITCKNCKYFNELCRHKSNTIIEICRKIETISYRSKKVKKEVCEFFENV